MTGMSLALYSGEPHTRSADGQRVADRFIHGQRETDMDNDNNVGGYDVPVDPMDDLQCDSCQ